MRQIKLMTHVVVGYPSLEETANLVKTMAEYAEYIELQIPFSDPLVDGPTIMQACEESLRKGTHVADAFSVLRQLSDEVSVPLLFMCYYNTVFNYGVKKFIQDAKKAGAAGLIVPDIPLEEDSYEHFYTCCRTYKMPVIFVVSPATPDDRLKKIAQYAEGFVYATARQGITGISDDSGFKINDLRIFLQRVRKYFKMPIAVGFGIATREQVQSLQGYADIAVVGSAILDIMNGSNDFMKGVENFLSHIKDPGQARMTKGKIHI
jgi:tryptophan synthase alpha subunit